MKYLLTCFCLLFEDDYKKIRDNLNTLEEHRTQNATYRNDQYIRLYQRMYEQY